MFLNGTSQFSKTKQKKHKTKEKGVMKYSPTPPHPIYIPVTICIPVTISQEVKKQHFCNT